MAQLTLGQARAWIIPHDLWSAHANDTLWSFGQCLQSLIGLKAAVYFAVELNKCFNLVNYPLNGTEIIICIVVFILTKKW